MKRIFCFLIIISTITLSSCIEETFPTNYAIESQVAGSSTALKSLVNAIPTAMIGWQNQSSGGQLETCSYSGLCVAFDEMCQDVVVAGSTGYNTWGTYSAMSNPTHFRQEYAWYMYYAWIRNVNIVLGLIDKDTQDSERQYFLGVAYAFRAFYYLNMVRMFEYKYTPLCPPVDEAVYGLGVPIVTEETTEEQAKNNPRVTVEENYNLIFSDLAKAERYLTQNSYARPSKSFPTLASVYGLYARAYLERGTAGVSGAYAEAARYARQAITTSGCTPLTQTQWQDPVNGFNNADSQNSWLWGICLSTDNVSRIGSSFYGLIMAEQTWTVYGWRVGRSISRILYEAIPDNDFRKYSWLDPVFYDLTDADGRVIRAGVDSYNGHEYKLAMPANLLRANMTKANGFNALPWIYNPIKFRPRGGAYSTRATGAAMDFPIMRVEEMYLIEAEAVARTQGLSQGINLLNLFMAYRITDGSYNCSSKCTDLTSLIDEIILQKRVELWGEGIAYYDFKRLEMGLHRGYKGINASVYNVTFDVDGIFPIWNCRIPEAERQGNPAMILNPIPLNAATLDLWAFKANSDLAAYYGCDLDNPDGE